MENGLVGTAIFIAADIAAALVILKMLGRSLPFEQAIRDALARWVWK